MTDEDPFDALDADAHSDREGDPFEHLRDGESSAAGDDASVPPEDSDSGAADRDPADMDSADPEAVDSGPTDPRTPDSDVDTADPLDDVTDPRGDPFANVDAPEGDPFAANADTFEAVDVAGVDPDEVWERLIEGDDAEAGSDRDDVADVPTDAFCEGCEHFSAPPDVECTHRRGEILEFVDMETVRVADCPVVAERRRLGHFEG